jgi:hypothetical protein
VQKAGKLSGVLSYRGGIILFIAVNYGSIAAYCEDLTASQAEKGGMESLIVVFSVIRQR